MYRARVLKYLVFTLVVFSAASILLWPSHASANPGINQELSFEGKVVNGSGINIADGTYNMEFIIYSGGTATGGGTPVWEEDYLVGGSGGGVIFSSGTFQVNLGSVCSFNGGACETYTNAGVNWDSYPLYLSLQVGNTSSCTVTTTFHSNCGGDGEMSPYILLTSTPYSFNSAELGGMAASAFAQVASANAFTGANTFQPTTNAVGVTVLQNSSATPTADIFDVQTVNNSSAIQVTGPSLNTANVTISAVGGANNVTVNPSGTGTLNLGTVASSNTIQIGSTTLSSGTQTINIGNNNTAGGTTNVLIGDGSSAAGGTTTIQANSQANIEVGNTAEAVTTNGAIVKTNTNSTTGFQLQNAGGIDLLQADTQNGTVLLSNGTNQSGGSIGTWASTQVLSTAVSNAATVSYNGYVYQLGGSTTGAVGGAISTSYYAPIDSNGTIGTWNPVTTLPSTGTGVWGASAVAYKGYVYEWGGTDTAGAMQTTVYYAQINSDGSLGTWVTAGNNPANASFGNVGVAYGGYIYQIGDATSSAAAGAATTSYFAPINANGTVGAWVATSAVTAARYLASVAVNNGYVYFIGGANTAGTTQTNIYYAQLEGSSGLGAFSATTTSLTTAVDGATAVVSNGDLDVIGGSTTNAAAGGIATTYTVPLAENGNITSAFSPTTVLTTALSNATSFYNNGFVYELGGLNTSGSTVTSSSYAYIFNGSSNNFESVNANGTSVSSAADSTSTFQVENNSGLNMIQVDTLNNQIILSNGNNDGGTLSASWSNSSLLTTAVSYAATVTYNGYIYQLGGSTGANNACATGATSPTNLTYYAPVSANGTVGAWTATTVLPAAVCGESAVAYGGYLYEWGGAIAAGTIQTTVEAAPINANGSIGAWAAAGNNPAAGPFGNVGVAYNGYIYQIGSATSDAAAGATTATYSAQITGGGTVGAWTAQAVLTGARYLASITSYNGIVYAVGGDSTAGTAQNTIYYATMSAGIAAWSTATTTLTTAVDAGSAVIQSGYLQVLGGTTTNAFGGAITNTYGVPVSGSGNITGSFVATTALPNALSTQAAVYVNGTILVVGGVNTAGNVVASIYYVQANSGNQNSVTTSERGVTVAGSVNSTASLEVQNASGLALLTVDSQDGLVIVGSGASGDNVGDQLVLDSKNTAGDPTGVDGAMYYNSSTGNFRCYEQSEWENCLGGLLYSNTGPNTVASCATAATCAAFTNEVAIPSTYCQPGRVIQINAWGVYNSTISVTFGIGVYWGTNAAKANDTLIGANSTAVASGAARTNQGWHLEFTMICDTYGAAGTITGEGMFALDTAAGTTLWNNLTTVGSSAVANNTASDLQIFPIIGTNNAGDNMIMEAMSVTGN